MSDAAPVVVAVVPARDAADAVGATVTAARSIPGVRRVLVVDDGSTDATAAVARAAGAEVLVLPANRGKGGAVRAGVEASPDADVVVLLDADLRDTAGAAARLLPPVVDGDADLAVAVLPAAGGRGGFGTVRRLAARGIRRASGFAPRAPLSGQRAVRAALLHDLTSAERFGLEVAMTVDAVRAGARVVEIDAPIEHAHTGRTVAGFGHRARQGADVVRALWPRLTSRALRTALVVLAALATLAVLLVGAAASEPDTVPAAGGAGQVVVVGVPRFGLDDLGTGRVPAIDALWRDGGAVAATTVRTRSPRPSTVEAWATLGAGARVRAGSGAADARPVDAPFEGDTAGRATQRRTGAAVDGELVVVTAPAVVDGAGADVPSEPGALGDALAAAGRRTGAVGNADAVDADGAPVVRRPAPVAVMTRAGVVDVGTVDAALLVDDPAAPFGRRADPDAVVEATLAALDEADVVVVDTGDLDRLATADAVLAPAVRERMRGESLARVDAVVERLAAEVGDDALLLVVGLTPPTREWALTPTVASGAGVVPGRLASASTRRSGLITLTDLAPTVLDALGVETPDGMIGAPLRYERVDADPAGLRRVDDAANGREAIYFPIAVTFIVVQAVVYLLAVVALRYAPGGPRVGGVLRTAVLAFAAWPLATYLLRAVPAVYDLGAGAHAVLWAVAVAVALVAGRARRHPLAPLSWICGATVALLLADLALGAPLQLSSLLGYSPHTAARFTGFGNTTFAVFGASAVLLAALHVHHAPRRGEALVSAAALLAVVAVADGAPQLGSDVGGILTLVPVFGLTLWVLTGRRISWRVVAVAGAVTLAALAVAIGIDLLRAPEARSHLGRFVLASGDDQDTFWTTIDRKWSTNLRVLQRTIWTWMVPIVGVFALYVLVVARGWRRLLPEGSAVRAGVVGVLATGLLGWLVNDSGVVVAALAFVYVGPLLTLLALAPGDRRPHLLGARPAAP
jgi:hypothetical protein